MSLCDVGGCGNSAIGEELAIYVAETGDYLEVSLCGDHPELMALQRGEIPFGHPDLTYTYRDVPVIDGVATLPNGMTVRSRSRHVRVASPSALPEPDAAERIGRA